MGTKPLANRRSMAVVHVPALLRRITEGHDRVVAQGSTVRDVIDDLDRQFPGFKNGLLPGGQLSGSVAVWVGGQVATRGLLEPVEETSEVYFLPAIGGGLI